ncbi:MAG TPA: dynamin family protein [Streptosporangiaceae bacterium]|nr:dynamin family protein [Streptosporangiaceae bacterium]
MPSSENTLVSALGELASLGTERDREQLAALLDRLDAARLRVLVVGEAKRGKSTLVNALLSRDVLPSGVTPLTAVTTTVRYGDDERAEVRFFDGHDEKHPLAVLSDLVTERGNPGNRRRIAGVTVYVAAPVLADGVELVDTPGTGSVFEWDTQAAHEALRSMDAALFVLTADPPVSASERDLLEQVARLSVRTFVVLNKADHLEEPGLAEALEFTQRVLGEAGHPGPVYPMSARAVLGGADAGFAAFEADFTAYLSARGKSDLQASAIAQARRIAGSLLDEVAVTRRVAGMRAGDAADRVRRFGERLAEVTVHGRDAVTVVNAESGRLLFALNDAAEEDRPRLAREVGRQLDELLGGSLREAPAGEIERRGRERLGAFAVAAAEAWRQRRREAIEQGLAAVDARLAGQLRAELSVLRESAAELLGLDLAVPEPEGRLAESRRFFYVTGEDIGQTELLAGAVRRRLPGEFGRRTARDHLRREVPDLVSMQVGRARGDLQYRLAEATRALARVVEQRYTDGTSRIRSALAAAAELRDASAAEAAARERELAGREAAVRHVTDLLDQAMAPR